MATGRRPRVRRWWIALAAAVVVLVPAGLIVVPILVHSPQGSSGQGGVAASWPATVTATGDDGRTRRLSVAASEGEIDTSAVHPGDRIVVRGSGYDGSRGIYVAVCRVPKAGAKPGPCIGGVPDQGEQKVEAGTVEYAPSNWINDDWAWRLFGARGFDDAAAGTFTAYLEIGNPVADGLDCTAEACAVFTRNDHTALADRVQDLHIPIAFAD